MYVFYFLLWIRVKMFEKYLLRLWSGFHRFHFWLKWLHLLNHM